MKNIFCLLLLALTMSVNAQVGINTNGSLPDNSAMLEVKSSSKGLLIPRMTANQRDAIASPATGLLIFCTDNNLYYSNKGNPSAPNWVFVNSQWISNGSSIYYSAGKVGIGASAPASVLDIAGGNNWDLANCEGDFRIGNNQFRLKAGVALDGGGAGAAGIMQYGQPGGYNVLSLGSQGTKLLFINGGSQAIGIGTDDPQAALDISSTAKGFLPPRMTQLQIIELTPVAGLQVFNTTTLKPNYYDGTQWRNFDGTFALVIGDGCYGGILAYILQSGDPGFDPHAVHGLIASSSSMNAEWGCYGIGIPGADGSALGTGNQNTIDIVAACNIAGIAAKLCSDLTLNGYSDWYLPSINELAMLYLNKTAIGGFIESFYWSSTETNNAVALCKSFNNAGGTYNLEKYNTFQVRAVRSF